MSAPTLKRGKNGTKNVQNKLGSMYTELKTLPQYTLTQLNALTPKSDYKNQLVFVTNGAAGQPCVAICDGTNWKVLSAVGANVS